MRSFPLPRRLVFGCFAVLSLALGAGLSIQAMELERHGARAVGHATSVRSEAGRRGQTATIRFDIPERGQVEAELPVRSGYPAVGDAVEILYDRRDPRTIEVDSTLERWSVPILALAAAVVLGLAAWRGSEAMPADAKRGRRAAAV